MHTECADGTDDWRIDEIQGIQPGPQIMTEQRELVWGVVVSMWVGNLMLLVINLPL